MTLRVHIIKKIKLNLNNLQKISRERIYDELSKNFKNQINIISDKFNLEITNNKINTITIDDKQLIKKIDENSPKKIIIVLDATTGQNALNQIEEFKTNEQLSTHIVFIKRH